jgi:hypothetical protein
MKKRPTNLPSPILDDFTKDYQKIVDSFERPIVLERQWKKQGDFFRKFSMYDHSYVSTESTGSSSLKI